MKIEYYETKWFCPDCRISGTIQFGKRVTREWSYQVKMAQEHHRLKDPKCWGMPNIEIVEANIPCYEEE